MHPELPLEFLRSSSEVSLWVSLKFLLEFLSEFPSTVSLSSSSISAPLLESELPLHGCRGLLACTNFGTAWAIYEKEERIAEHTQALRVCSTGEHGAALILSDGFYHFHISRSEPPHSSRWVQRVSCAFRVSAILATMQHTAKTRVRLKLRTIELWFNQLSVESASRASSRSYNRVSGRTSNSSTRKLLVEILVETFSGDEHTVCIASISADLFWLFWTFSFAGPE